MSEILLDCDGLLSDFVAGTVAVMGLPSWVPSPEWRFLSNLAPAEQDRARALWRRPGFIRKLPLVEGSQRAISQLRDTAPVRIVTALPTQHDERLEWLWEHYRIDEKQVTFRRDKSGVTGLVFMDDLLDNVLDWGARHNRRAYLFGRDHNRSHAVPYRVDTWEEATPLLITAAREGVTT